VTRLRAEGARIGYVRPITLLPFPSEILASAARGARTVAVYENSSGQMIDDVRLAVEGAVPVQFIGRLSLDGSGFGIAPDLDGDYLRDRLLDALNTEVLDG
jgi:2-oxoglutarate ferredoxin oxidoreductase subunit alpha